MNSWKILLACAIAAVSLGAIGCDRSDKRETASATPPASAPARPGSDATAVANREMDLDDFLDNWNGHVGQDVTVVGRVDKVLSPTVLQLKDSDPIAKETLLVFVPRDASISAFDTEWVGDRVRIMGPAARASLADIEERVGPMSAEIRTEIERQGPMIVARSVMQLP